MRKSLLLSLVILGFAARIFAGDIGKLSSGDANIETLRGTDRAAVAKFINATRSNGWAAISDDNVGEFGWARVASGEADFVVLLDFSGRSLFNELRIYSGDSAGKVEFQELDGWRMGELKDIVRDLDSDGKDELIIPTALPPQPSGIWWPISSTPTWPAVYRLKNGKYVEASRDFPNFYDEEILPQLQMKIRKAPTDGSAGFILEKSKILRVLGRDPAAGLQEAYQWMNSDDPQLMQCAIVTLGDIGGHEKEVRELRQALPAAEKHEMESRKGG